MESNDRYTVNFFDCQIDASWRGKEGEDGIEGQRETETKTEKETNCDRSETNSLDIT